MNLIKIKLNFYFGKVVKESKVGKETSYQVFLLSI